MARNRIDHPKTEQVITLLTIEDRHRLAVVAQRERVTTSELVRDWILDRLRTDDAMQGAGRVIATGFMPGTQPLPGMPARPCGHAWGEGHFCALREGHDGDHLTAPS